MQCTYYSCTGWQKRKNKKNPTNRKELAGLVGNLFRLGKKSEILICIYTDPVYWYLRKWVKSYKTRGWCRGKKERAQAGQQPSACCQSPRCHSILQDQSSLSTACQIRLKAQHIPNPFPITSNSVNFSLLNFSVNENHTFAEQIQDGQRKNKTLFKFKSTS